MKRTTVLLALFCSACAQMKSSDIKSRGIYATHTVTATNGSVQCVTTLRAGESNGTYIDLDGSDALYCNGVRMSRQGDVLKQISYVATLPAAPRSTYEIRFEREGETLRAAATLPSTITNATIVGGNTQRIGHSMTVTWHRSSFPDESTQAILVMRDDHHSKFDSATVYDATPETGRATFTPEDAQIRYYDAASNSYQRAHGPYSATIELVRSTPGSLSGAWKGSMISQSPVRIQASFHD